MNKKNKFEQDALVAAAFQQHLSRQLFEEEDSVSRAIKQMNKKKSKPVATAIVDTGIRKSHTSSVNKTKEKKEYVIGAKKYQSLPKTLAEKMGLIESSKQKALDEQDWTSAKSVCLSRGDPALPCPICQEDFGLKQTVLLSCTHVFHRTCLEAFERFSGRQTCPLCRRNEYEKRVIYDAEKHYYGRCAVMIQSYWRGYLVRKWYRRYREKHPPKNPILRQKWCEERLATVTDRVIESMDLNVDNFLAELSDDIQRSREVFSAWDKRSLGKQKWDTVLQQHLSRNTAAECPICLSSWSKDRPRVLLSCSHVFHDLCLTTLERLSESGGSRLCPVCRSGYSKQYITHDNRLNTD